VYGVGDARPEGSARLGNDISLETVICFGSRETWKYMTVARLLPSFDPSGSTAALFVFSFRTPSPGGTLCNVQKTCRYHNLLTPAENVQNLLIPNARLVSAPVDPGRVGR